MTTDVAKVYGGALYDLAAEEGLEDELLTQQQTLTQVLAAEPQWLRLLAIPSIPKPERTALLDEALAGVHPYLVTFSKILCERESIGELPACFKEYRRRYNKAHGIVPKTIIKDVREILEISKSEDSGRKTKGKPKKLTDAERAAEIAKLEQEMKEASKLLEFEYAAVLRDRIIELKGGK